MPINDEEMKKEIIETVIQNYDYTREEAEKFAKAYSEYVVDAMWEAFSEYISQQA